MEAGWFKNWGGKDPCWTAKIFIIRLPTSQNYYMCHGGTDFGRIASSPYITTSCDYDATLDEFDNLNQPKRGHWKDFQTILK